ncbi:MAG: biopolymer transporter ExbD [Synergistaceae bacterium]|jgi:biopolymer transport protein ExbD|nr:biopolymer transporter ExbD [Synergistaceae bacterium]
MTRQGSRRGRKRKAVELDITSLIDVLFMLIIFFVITTAFVQGSVNVSLPSGTPPPLSDREQIVLTITKDSEILWAGERLASEDLAQRVMAALAESADILLAGDRDARYGNVAELMDQLRRQGVPSVGLAFEGGN